MLRAGREGGEGEGGRERGRERGGGCGFSLTFEFYQVATTSQSRECYIFG